MNTLIKKLSSRKLWAAVVGIATGLGMVFGLDEGVISTVSGAVVAVASVITYIITEGKVDAAAVKMAVESVQEAAAAVTGTTEDGDGT
jgi:phage shock protein PspC (stress-responsive transcriptional regulator)